MKIVYATDAFYPRVHGVSVSIDAAINYLAEQGHEVHIIAPEYPAKDERSYPDNIIIHRYPSYNLFFTTNKEERFVYPKYLKQIRSLLSEIDPDVVHIHLEFAVGITARSWAIKNNKPLVITSYTYYPEYIKLYIPYLPMNTCFNIAKYGCKWFYKPSDKLIVISKEYKEVLQNEYGLTNDMQILIMGIDESHFVGFDKESERQKSLEQYPEMKGKKVLLFIGRITEEKNVSFLLKVMQQMASKRDDLHLLLVGGGSHVDIYKNMVAELGIEKETTFVDAVSHDRLRDYYALADVFTFPGKLEAQGLVTIEAMHLGIPAVAIDAMGTKTFIENDEGGFLVDEDIDLFSEKVNLLLDNEKLYEEKSKQAIDRGQKFVFARTGEGLVKIYNEVIANHKS